jgi:YegS/Rv2252/BmrU family lipid kinase
VTLSVIVNPAAGGGRAGRALDGVHESLQRLGLEHRIEATRSLDHARDLARWAAAAGETAVAFGGDGLIGAVAGALRDSDGLLGVLPGGRGNDFARALGIPLDPRAACEVLATGTTRSLDLGEVNGRTFVGIASCGIDADANRIANRSRRVGGNLVYSYAALRALAQWRPAAFTITIDGGRPHTITGYTIAVANSSSYGGGMRLAPAARLDDGLLEIVVIADMTRLRFLRLLPTVFWGGHVNHAGVEILQGRHVEIAASRPLEVYADGDPIAHLPATVRALPGAVRALVPASPVEPLGWVGSDSPVLTRSAP